ncbi:2-phosphosulfolactate phosphatase [Athalassotoga saccharophila]|uniref:2-phosphosulfolactate phosphatase n=1 Tax=Athalassotoga saccharophila TaxID=1441386 RepID=UPI00137A9166|nr:2-phosphosulfolactate phosphatase [Athalassotoga saccharophila]BBJ28337.1 putative 2-phosphosulfolactate phosphatase [Athalassotoga saccharophila]
MRSEVLLLPSKPRLDSYDLVIIIDTLRATTVISRAIHEGAMAVYPAISIPRARILKKIVPNAILAGERKAFKIKGFDLGNSPSEFTKESVGGKNVIITTTNGTKAVERYKGYGPVVAMALSNLRAIYDYSKNLNNLLIVCAGSHGEVSLEDTYTAGRFLNLFDMVGLNDGGILAREIAMGDSIKVLKTSRHGRYLSEIGMYLDIEESLVENDAVPILKTDVNNINFFGGAR